MLTALHIRDYVLIRDARLEMASGLTALTGETGAGKSILLDALGFAAGARADRSGVRSGAKQGAVTAAFEPRADHPVWTYLEENGFDLDDDQLILRRVQDADGRTRGFINDAPASIGALRAVGEILLEIHGQHDGRGFLKAAAHRGMLDEFGGLKKRVDAVGAAWRRWRDAEESLAARRRDRDAAMRESDYLRHVVRVLEDLAPEPGEESRLAEKRATMMASEKIADDLSAAIAALEQTDVEGRLSKSLHAIERAAARVGDAATPLGNAAARLEAALLETGEARAAIDNAVAVFDADPAELERTEARLFALRAEARKHGVEPDALVTFFEKTKAALEDLELGEAAFGDLETEAKLARDDYDEKAAALSAKRKAAAKKLDKAVAGELAPLKLGRAVFETVITVDADNPVREGVDHVEFMVATNPGAPAGPLKTIASGGELSRFVLAMKAALAAKDDRTVIIFDEVDAGVGGAVADAVGERLARLAGDAQVLVVTHSPQVAARGAHHWRVEKTQTKSATEVSVTPLTSDARIEELARMLSGAEVTDEARAAAHALLEIDGKPKRKRASAKRPQSQRGAKKLATG
ncbi:MAG: DNA repair protein RecN [Pseudomonadota bacterium]